MQDEMFVVPHDLDVRTVAGVRRDLLAWIEKSPETVPLDIGDPRPTQDSLQVLFAAMIEARNRGLTLSLGETAAQLAARVTDWGAGQGAGGEAPAEMDQPEEVAG